MTLDDLLGIERQKLALVDNTRAFLQGLPANHALLWGARGTGKSSMVRALLREYAEDGLRLVEIERDHLADLPQVLGLLADQPQRFILFCDDLSFEAGETAYKALKSVLDGSVAAPPENVLIYATSNRRHLMPEYFAENLDTKRVDDEIHPGEAVEEKISLSERFGLWLSFYPFDQDAYLTIAAHWLRTFGLSDAEVAKAEREALNWALMRGSRSGRVAWQFAKDWAAQHGKRPAGRRA